MARRPHRPLGAAALVAATIACSTMPGCARRVAQPVYAEPPPPRALTITAQRRQSQRQQDRDKGDCQYMASREASSSTTWVQIFTSCMGGRGYLVE